MSLGFLGGLGLDDRWFVLDVGKLETGKNYPCRDEPSRGRLLLLLSRKSPLGIGGRDGVGTAWSCRPAWPWDRCCSKLVLRCLDRSDIYLLCLEGIETESHDLRKEGQKGWAELAFKRDVLIRL